MKKVLFLVLFLMVAVECRAEGHRIISLAPNATEMLFALGQAAQGRHAAPDHQGDGDDVDPIGAVGEPGDGDAEHGVEQREGETGHQPDLSVVQTEVELDRLSQDGDDLAIEKVEHVNDDQHGQHVGSVSG